MAEPLKRIPFSVADELTIAGSARWMRFMGGFQIVACLLGLFALLIASVLIGFGAASLGGELGGELGEMMGAALTFALIVGLLVVGLGLWSGSLLYRAADAFDLVAKTDEADQDYLALGFQRLRTFFVIEALTGALGVLSALSAFL